MRTEALDRSGGLASLLWVVAAVLSVASVLIINGRPLFYYDTVGYYAQGTVALDQLGGAPDPMTTAKAADAGTGPVAAAPRTVDGSRSPFYSLLAGVFARIGVFDALLLFNGACLYLSLWLLSRIVQRLYAPGASRARLVAVPVIAASLGSLPFYAAYLMPDLMAPVLLLVVATLAAFARSMGRGELLLAFALGSLAIVSHLSHFAIGAALVPATALIAVIAERRRWWLAPLIVAAIVGVAFVQQVTFRVLAQRATHSEVVIKPFLTARLIQDGPGYDWLASHCPDAAVPTCKLWEALQWSDDPYRLTASHIVFETSKRLGSLRLMTPEDQKAVADAQVDFFRTVLTDMPFAVTTAVIGNALKQSAMVSIDMTVQTDEVVDVNRPVTGVLSGPLDHGRITQDRQWIGPLVAFQRVLYAGSLVIALALIVSRGLPGGLRAFGVMIILGILANALVCGGISQPATRYGARVIWLLPMLAAMLFYWAAHAAEDEE